MEQLWIIHQFLSQANILYLAELHYAKHCRFFFLSPLFPAKLALATNDTKWGMKIGREKPLKLLWLAHFGTAWRSKKEIGFFHFSH